MHFYYLHQDDFELFVFFLILIFLWLSILNCAHFLAHYVLLLLFFINIQIRGGGSNTPNPSRPGKYEVVWARNHRLFYKISIVYTYVNNKVQI